MPRLKRRTMLRRSAINANHIWALCTGFDFWGDLSGRMGPSNLLDSNGRERAREIWQAVRDEVLPRYTGSFPGFRPAAWWSLDSPCRRERVDGRCHPFDSKERQAYIRKHWPNADPDDHTRGPYKLSFGLPSALVQPDFRDSPKWESQFTYLQRLGLLMPGEGEAFEAGGPGEFKDDDRPDVTIELIKSWGWE